MKGIITLVTPIIGSVDCVVTPNTSYPNTFEIGSKRIDFSEMLPPCVNLHYEDDWHIIIWIGINPDVEIIFNYNTYKGKLYPTRERTEGLVAEAKD